MLRSMNSAISGLRQHQLFMDVIGNNIANVNTNAFKSGRISFQTLLTQTIRSSVAPTESRGGINSVQVGLGSSVAAVEQVQTQGGFQPTNKITDMAIQGEGFFVMTDGFQNFYTRDGSFDLDQNGVLISPNSGLRVSGWPADRGVIDPTRQASAPLTIPLGQAVASKLTTAATFNGNLNGEATHVVNSGVVESTVEPAGTTGKQPSMGFPIADGDTITFTYNGKTYTTIPGNGNLSAAPPVPATNGGLSGHAQGDQIQNVALDIQNAMYEALEAAGDAPGGLAAADMPIQVGFVDDAGRTGGEAFLTFTADKALQFGNAPSTNLKLSDALRSRGSKGLEVVKTVMQVYDSLGNPHNITVQFEKVTKTTNAAGGDTTPPGGAVIPPAASPDTWKWTAFGGAVDDSGTDAAGKPLGGGWGYIKFDPSGAFQSVETRQITLSGPNFYDPVAQSARAVVQFDWNNGAGNDQEVELDFSQLTQLMDGNTVNLLRQDGYGTGTLLSFVVGADGVINGQFSNGISRPLGQVALATFANVAGLNTLGSNLFTESPNSGLANIGVARTQSRGTINAGQLEMSNVDLGQQFTDMIRAQRGFQANSRIITTSDEMLQDLVNLKR